MGPSRNSVEWMHKVIVVYWYVEYSYIIYPDMKGFSYLHKMCCDMVAT